VRLLRGGRQKGTPNRKSAAVASLKYLAVILSSAWPATATYDSVELSGCVQRYKELAQYVAPKREAVEMGAQVSSSWTDAVRACYAIEKGDAAVDAASVSACMILRARETDELDEKPHEVRRFTPSLS
jgi:hypothetical protein